MPTPWPKQHLSNPNRRNFLTVAIALPALGLPEIIKPSQRPKLLAHYMPWFQAKPFSKTWGWHWTMNRARPDILVGGRPEIASHYHPLIGPYDSSDPAVIECHLLQMRLAGIDGVVVDWYGLSDFRDYPLLHTATSEILKVCAKYGLGFAICYEDQTIPALVTAGRLEQKSRVSHASGELSWLAANWFRDKAYIRFAGAPLLLSFGQTGLTDDEWASTLAASTNPVAYFSEHRARPCARGAFDWPLPKKGLPAQRAFEESLPVGLPRIPVAFPRFEDYYSQAGVGPSHGHIPDDSGKTFHQTVSTAMASGPEFIQIATWNDWGEGTQIEPSMELGYRDLEALLSFRKSLQPSFPSMPTDLSLPALLLKARKTSTGKDNVHKLDQIARQLATLDLPTPRDLLNRPSRLTPP